MWSTLADEVKIVNESMMCFSQQDAKKGVKVKSADLLNKS